MSCSLSLTFVRIHPLFFPHHRPLIVGSFKVIWTFFLFCFVLFLFVLAMMLMSKKRLAVASVRETLTQSICFDTQQIHIKCLMTLSTLPNGL